MMKLFKHVSKGAVVAALVFLVIQVACTLYLPYLTADIVNQGILQGNIDFIWSQGRLMLALTVISLLAAYLNTVIAARVSFNFGNRLRELVYQKVLSFSKEDYDSFGTSSLITRNITDVSQVQNLMSMFLKFLVLAPLYLIGGITLTYLLSPKLAMVFLAVLPLLFIAAIVVHKIANPLYEKMQQTVDRLNAIFREGLSGVKVIRAFNQERLEENKYQESNKAYQETSIKAGSIMSAFIPLITLLMNVTTLVVLWFGSHDVVSGVSEIGTIMAVLNYSGQILMGFGILTSVILAVPRGQVSAKRINEVLERETQLQKNPASTPVINVTAGLVLADVGFSYPGAAKGVLEQVSLSAQTGQTLAIIGGTGGGKSTLLNLLNRQYEPTEGTIYWQKQALDTFDKSQLNDVISVTPQKATLFRGTIRSNLLLAGNANDDELWQVLELAQARQFVSQLPDGLDSHVEAGGDNFSGGQKQRLCIARSILKEADIYLFDDSFSALDFKTDRAIRNGLKLKLADKLTIIVAQRINTIVEADVIVVLDQGKVVGTGTHKELVASNKVYQEIVNSQQEEVAA